MAIDTRVDKLPSVSILIVDDHHANLVALEAILRPLGHRLVMARSGEEAFKQLLRHDFAVILMDVQMPGIDGFQTAALIKQRERNRHVPIIFLTAMSKDPAAVLKGYEQGAVDYILKPFDPEILRSKISVFVELFVQKEQIKRQAALLREQEKAALERKGDLRYRALMDAMPLYVSCMRPSGHVYYCNHLWRSHADVTQGQNLDQAYWNAIHPDDRDALRAARTDAERTGKAYELQYRIRRQADGVYRWHLGRTVPELDETGQITGWITAATDIDDQKSTAAKLQEALAIRDEFLSTAGHELRTPLTSLQLTVAGLMRNGGANVGGMTPQALDKLRTVDRLIRRQAKLIEDLLDVSRITAGRLQLELQRVDLSAIAREVAVRFEDELRAANCAFSLVSDGPIVGDWDPTRLDQVITNLLSNAIKYGHDRPIKMTVEADARRAFLRVCDQGIGIAEADRARIFERFARAVPDQNYTGFGLGLWISRQIIEGLGGEIHVTSEVGIGSVFTVELPLADQGRPEGASNDRG